MFAVAGVDADRSVVGVDDEAAGELDVDGLANELVGRGLDPHALTDRECVLAPRRQHRFGVVSKRVEPFEEALDEPPSVHHVGMGKQAGRTFGKPVSTDVDPDTDDDPRDPIGLALHLGQDPREFALAVFAAVRYRDQ